jgi:hypothetical protein
LVNITFQVLIMRQQHFSLDIEAPLNKLRGISDRERNRKPRLVGGVKRRTEKGIYYSPSAHESSISLPGSTALWAGSFIVKENVCFLIRSLFNSRSNDYNMSTVIIGAGIRI